MRHLLKRMIHDVASLVVKWTEQAPIAEQDEDSMDNESMDEDYESESTESMEDSEIFYHIVHEWKVDPPSPITKPNPHLYEPNGEDLDAFLFRYDRWDVDEN